MCVNVFICCRFAVCSAKWYRRIQFEMNRSVAAMNFSRSVFVLFTHHMRISDYNFIITVIIIKVLYFIRWCMCMGLCAVCLWASLPRWFVFHSALSIPCLNKSLEINELITHISMCISMRMWDRACNNTCVYAWQRAREWVLLFGTVYSSLPIILKRSRMRQRSRGKMLIS